MLFEERQIFNGMTSFYGYSPTLPINLGIFLGSLFNIEGEVGSWTMGLLINLLKY